MTYFSIMEFKENKSIWRGFMGGISLLLFYFLTLIFANSLSHAISQFLQIWYWVLILAAGFGSQIGLYSHIQNEIKETEEKKAASREIAASGGVSAVSMIACCAHHLIDVLPILGLSALFLFFAEYQMFFIILGVGTNALGIIFMLEIIKKHSFYREGGVLSKIVKFDFKTVKKLAIIFSLTALLISFFWVRSAGSSKNIGGEPAEKTESLKEKKIPLSPIAVNESGISITAAPIDFSFGQPVQFKITLDTHQGDLNFNLAEISVLIDDRNNQYRPKEWQGGTGGHHLSGTLIFPAVKEAKWIKLIIKNIGAKEVEFLWNLE